MRIPCVSIIVPIYKAEKYIGHCIDSLCKQTLCDFEIIFVDDGSPDRSGEICDEYAKKDARVRVFHKENGGVGTARQTGLKMATGEYVIHVDPDDWVEPNMLEYLYDYAKKNDADMVICDYFEHREDGEHYIVSKPRSLYNQDIVKELFSTLHGSCCNKLVRRSCIERCGAHFPSLALCEDTFFNVSLLMHPLNVFYLNMAFYHYDRTNGNSVTREGNPKTGLYAFEACLAFRLLLSDKDEYWPLFVEKEMPWMAYLTLYYGSVSGNEFQQEYKELLSLPAASVNDKIVKLALRSYFSGRMLMIIRSYIGKIRKSLC